jgi:hypothetical protein
MPIVFPLALPASPEIRRVQFGGRSVVGASQSPFDLSEQVFPWAGRAWRASVALPVMVGAQAAPWRAFFASLNGREGTFLMGDPFNTTPRGVASGTPLVDGAAQAGSSLATKGWDNSVTGILLKGDYFQLGSGATARLYVVLNDADSDGAGLATLDIWPPLRASPADSEALVINSPAGLWRMATNILDWDTDEAALYGISFDAAEAL